MRDIVKAIIKGSNSLNVPVSRGDYNAITLKITNRMATYTIIDATGKVIAKCNKRNRNNVIEAFESICPIINKALGGDNAIGTYTSVAKRDIEYEIVNGYFGMNKQFIEMCMNGDDKGVRPIAVKELMIYSDSDGLTTVSLASADDKVIELRAR